MSFDPPYVCFLIGILLGLFFIFDLVKSLSLKTISKKKIGIVSFLCLFSFTQASWSFAMIEQLNFNTHYGRLLSYVIEKTIDDNKDHVQYDEIINQYNMYNESVNHADSNFYFLYMFFSVIALLSTIAILKINDCKTKYIRIILPVLLCFTITLCCSWTWLTAKTLTKPYYYKNYSSIAKIVCLIINKNLAMKSNETKKILSKRFYAGKYSHENITSINSLLHSLPIHNKYITRKSLDTDLKLKTIIINWLLVLASIIYFLIEKRRNLYSLLSKASNTKSTRKD